MAKNIFLSAILVLWACTSMAQQYNFTITAHSGAYGTEDNSMEYIETALAHDDDILEFDVRCRPNGTLAMSHDDIKTNDDGVLISDVLKKVKGHRTKINLDIKEVRALSALYSLIKQLGIEKQVLMTGIEEKDIPEVRRECPGIEFYLNCKPEKKLMKTKNYREQLIKTMRESGIEGVNCYFKYCTKRLVNLLHENGFKLSIWTVNEIKDMKKYVRFNPDNITTRKPDELRRIINP